LGNIFNKIRIGDLLFHSWELTLAVIIGSKRHASLTEMAMVGMIVVETSGTRVELSSDDADLNKQIFAKNSIISR